MKDTTLLYCLCKKQLKPIKITRVEHNGKSIKYLVINNIKFWDFNKIKSKIYKYYLFVM
jgi:hypothetical protein